MQIKLTDISYVYSPKTPQQVTALDGINLTIQAGTITGIIGHTGSGKSTLIQLMNGLIKPTSGQVWVGNIDITEKKINLAHIRQQVGLVFQYPEHQLFEDKVYNDVAFGPRNLGLTADEVHQRVRKSLGQVGLDVDELGELSPLTLSGGQKRRVAIAGVLAMEPQVLILDEPTAALDPVGRKDLLRLLDRMRQQEGLTIVLVSHSMDDVARLADQLVVLEQGQVVLQGPPREIFNDPRILDIQGIQPPQVVFLMKALQESGLEVSTSVLTVAEAAEEILVARRKACV